MENEAPDRRKQGYILRRAILDYGMGIVIFGFGILFFFAPKWGITLSIDDLYRSMFSGLCLLYGGFRIYRGSRKDYFK